MGPTCSLFWRGSGQIQSTLGIPQHRLKQLHVLRITPALPGEPLATLLAERRVPSLHVRRVGKAVAALRAQTGHGRTWSGL